MGDHVKAVDPESSSKEFKKAYDPPRILAKESLECVAADCTSAPPGLTAKSDASCTFAFS